MKKLATVLGLSVAVLASNLPAAYAASDVEGPFVISASVPSTFDLKVTLHKNTSTGAVITAMAFGTLVKDPTFQDYRSSVLGSTGTGSVVAMISCESTVGPYTISQTGTALTKGADVIPAGACVVNNAYSPLDNGGGALDGTLGTGGSWVGTRLLYTSHASGQEEVFQSHYAITSDPAANATAAVPSSQPAGAYTASVTFNATT